MCFYYCEIHLVHRAITTPIQLLSEILTLTSHELSPLWLLRLQNRYSHSWCKSRPRPFSWVQNNLPQLSLHGTVKSETQNCPCFSQFSLKKRHAASFTSSSSAFSSSSSDSRSSLLFLLRRLTGLSAWFTWQPLLVLRFLLFPLFLQSSGMSLVPLNIQNWKQNQIKSATILLQYSQCLCTSSEEWGYLRWEPEEVNRACRICQIRIFSKHSKVPAQLSPLEQLKSVFNFAFLQLYRKLRHHPYL